MDTLGNKRNVGSLKYIFDTHKDKNFTIRFLGQSAVTDLNATFDEIIPSLAFLSPSAKQKIDIISNTDPYDFMLNVGKVDAILPLVDGMNFHHFKGYQDGKKLSSSVTWGLGFHKKMVIYEPLANTFGIQEDNATFWLYSNYDSFAKAFGRCLEHLLETRTEIGGNDSLLFY